MSPERLVKGFIQMAEERGSLTFPRWFLWLAGLALSMLIPAMLGASAWAWNVQLQLVRINTTLESTASLITKTDALLATILTKESGRDVEMERFNSRLTRVEDRLLRVEGKVGENASID